MKAFLLLFVAVGVVLLSSGGNVADAAEYGSCPVAGSPAIYVPHYENRNFYPGFYPNLIWTPYQDQYKMCSSMAAMHSSSAVLHVASPNNTNMTQFVNNVTSRTAGFACNVYPKFEEALFSTNRVSANYSLLDIFPSINWEAAQNYNTQYQYPVIFGGASLVQETAVLLKYGIAKKHATRIIIYDVADDNIGISNYTASQDVIHHAAALLDTVEFYYFNPENTLQDFINIAPQYGIMLNAPNFSVVGLIWDIYTPTVTCAPCYTADMGVQGENFAVLQSMINYSRSYYKPSNAVDCYIIVAGSHHIAKETQYEYVKQFNADYKRITGTSPKANDPTAQFFPLAGWLQGFLTSMIFNITSIPSCATGEPYVEYFLNEFLSMDQAVLTNHAIWKTVQMGNSTFGGGYNLDIYDYHVGGLTVAPVDSGAISCRLGGRFVQTYAAHVTYLSYNVTGMENAGVNLTTSDTDCYYYPSSFEHYMLVTFFNTTDTNLGMNQVTEAYISSVISSMPALPPIKSTKTAQSIQLQFNTLNKNLSWEDELKELNSAVFMGVSFYNTNLTDRVSLGMVSNAGAQIDDFPGYVFSVTPTLRQSVYDMYGLLLTNGANPSGSGSVGPSDVYRARFSNPVRLFYGNMSADQVSLFTDVAAKAAAYWNQDAPDVYNFSDIKSNFSTNGVNFVQGAIGSEVNIVTLLKNNPEAYIFLPWSDFIQMYPALLSYVFQQSSTVGTRILTSSNLPLWSSQDPAVLDRYPLLKDFHATMPISDTTPSHFTVYAELKLLQTVMLEGVASPSASSFVDTVYRVGTFDLKGVVVQFSNDTCAAEATGSVPCYSSRNWGANDNHLISFNQAYNYSAPIQYPALSLTSETTTTPGLLSPAFSQLETPVKPLGDLGKAGIAVGIVFLIIGFLLVLGGLGIVLLRRSWRREKEERLSSLLNLSVPVTTVTFSFDDIVIPVLEVEGASGALRTLKSVEAVIQREMKEYGVIEIENCGCTIVGVSINPVNVLQCCEKVKHEVKALGTELPNVTTLIEPGVDGEGGTTENDGAYNEMRNGMNENQRTQDNASRDVEVDSSKKERRPARCTNVYVKHPMNDDVRGEDTEYINVGSPRVGMGVTTGLLQRIEEEGATGMICGMGLPLSRLFAEQLSCGETVLPNSTWYSLSESESLLVLCGGFFQYFLPCLATASRSLSDDELVLYRAGKVDALKKRGQPLLFDLDREVTLGMALSLLLARVAEKERIPFLVRLIEFQGAEVPSRLANANDLMYIATLLDELEACSPTSRNEAE